MDQTSNILCFISDSVKVTPIIRATLENIGLKIKTEVYQSIEQLKYRLSLLGRRPSIAIMLVGNKEELLKLHSFRSLFSETPIILVLPHQEALLTAIGYELHPKLLTYLDQDFMEVAFILTKMRENYLKKIGNEAPTLETH